MASLTSIASTAVLAVLLVLLGGAGASGGAEPSRGSSSAPAPRLWTPPPPGVLDGRPVAIYDRRLGTIQLFDGADFSIAAPRGGGRGAAEGPIVWQCDIQLVCCSDTEEGGCTDFLFKCAEEGGTDTSFGGGMAGTCDVGG